MYYRKVALHWALLNHRVLKNYFGNLQIKKKNNAKNGHLLRCLRGDCVRSHLSVSTEAYDMIVSCKSGPFLMILIVGPERVNNVMRYFGLCVLSVVVCMPACQSESISLLVFLCKTFSICWEYYVNLSFCFN